MSLRCDTRRVLSGDRSEAVQSDLSCYAGVDRLTGMTHSLDLAAYFARIGYTGSQAPTLATLNAMMSRHVQSIPFENLDVLLNRPISIETAAIVDKLVHQRRGGYCFEHNTLFLCALEALGFTVTAISARSRYQRAVRDSLPRTHVFLRVELEGESYLVDVGFGGLSLTASLRLVLDGSQDTPNEPRRIVSEGRWDGFKLRAPDAVLVHQAYFANNWHDLCEFTLEPMSPIDREMGNWYTSTHPRSHFREHLMVARATPEGRVILSDSEFTWRQRDGSAKSRVLQTHGELLDTLAAHFDLNFPGNTRFACPALTLTS
jgi:N-hydroxyarylamine O-acetyltransferase